MAWLGIAAAAAQTVSALSDSHKSSPAPQKAPLLPDEESLKKAARRKSALRFGQLGTGKASTILSQPTNQPLGG